MRMENEPKTLEQRVADLEAAMNEMATIIAPASLRTLGTNAALKAFVLAMAQILPPGTPSNRLVLELLDELGRDLHGSMADDMTLKQFDSDRQLIEQRLGHDPVQRDQNGAPS